MQKNEDFLIHERKRIGKLFSTKHKPGFQNKYDLINWYEGKITKQDFKCYYCDTSIFDINLLIDANKLKKRKILFGFRGPVLEIDKKNNDSGYTPGNCVLSCYYCNNDKSYTLDSDDYKKNFGENRNKYFMHLKNI
jgi:hypothetical protein